tara:strand:+ start:566 stop:799 length:234 start_codon:yes stop_codon:yes gene_type:complete
MNDIAKIHYDFNTYSKSDNNPLPTIEGGDIGSFRSNPYLLIDTITGVIYLKESPVGDYVIKYTTENKSSEFNISITP